MVQKLNINTISLSTQLKFDGAEISLDDTGCPISVEIENNEIYIGYNVDFLMNADADGKEMQNLAAATAMYGYYAKLYFA